MMKALRKPSVALLWGGQALSQIGDEIYRVALIWLAVGLIGNDTGYLDAGRFGAILALSVFGGIWADRWDHFKTLIRVDLLRAVIVLIPVFVFHFHSVSLPILWVMALALSGLCAFFDPALLAMVPRISKDPETIKAANGLMATTFRFARVIGPAIVGLLSPLISTIHFFTLDALTYGFSALSIILLRARATRDRIAPQKPVRSSFRESLMGGIDAIAPSRKLRFIMMAKGLGGGLWSLGYLLGLALLIHRIAPTDVRAYGLASAAYGVGNFAGALYFGNIRRDRPELILYVGYLLMGAGFSLVGFSPNFTWLVTGCALSGFGGLMTDLPFVDIVQSRFSHSDLTRVFRLRMAVETGATMFFLALAPTLFRFVPIESVISGCGAVFVVFGAIGLSYFMEDEVNLLTLKTFPSKPSPYK